MGHFSSIATFQLENGLDIVVIPDRRAPVVTHMVYYKNGAADDPLGKSGIAHFLEHLMFKGTKVNPKGVFSTKVAALGGQENAFTSYDYTAYYQRVAKEHLGAMMALEADRMTGLVLEEAEVLSERDVVLEERKMRTDVHPESKLYESLQAANYIHHPYGLPIIGWRHEIESLSREDALAYYHRFYRPDNAILIVAGDVEAQDVLRLAQLHYGPIPKPETPFVPRKRVNEPEHHASHKISVQDDKVEQPVSHHLWRVPSHNRAEGGEAFALEVLSYILGATQTSMLYRKLVLEQKCATMANSGYWNDALDTGQLIVTLLPAEGVSLEFLDKAAQDVMEDLAQNCVPSALLTRTKTRLVADMVYAQDSQTHLARIYGTTLTTGGKVEDVRLWSEKIEKVNAEEVRAVAARYLTPKRVVIGHLLCGEKH